MTILDLLLKYVLEYTGHVNLLQKLLLHQTKFSFIDISSHYILVIKMQMYLLRISVKLLLNLLTSVRYGL